MNKQNITHEYYMQLALELARQGLGTTSPNPMVGCVIVKNEKVIGQGFHVRSGEPHAEPNAINSCIEDVSGADLYVTLEPCCHTNKKTPPCVNLIIEKKIKRVFVACLDPNPEVAGRGIEILKKAGIETQVGILEQESNELNEVFNKAITTNLPFVHLKLAQTLDGKMSTLSGDSKWITDELARKEVHKLRLKYDAVMIGKNTLNNDNPSLDIRMGVNNKNKTPYRVILGNPDSFDMTSKILSDDNPSKTIVLATSINKSENRLNLEARGIKFIEHKSFNQSLRDLKALGIQSILVEGGARLAEEIIESELYDRISIYVAPKVVGQGLSYFNKDNKFMADAINFEQSKVRVVGNQAVFEVRK